MLSDAWIFFSVSVFYQPASLLMPPCRASVEKFLSQSIRYASLLVDKLISEHAPQ
jgi:hypothetical protein